MHHNYAPYSPSPGIPAERLSMKADQLFPHFACSVSLCLVVFSMGCVRPPSTLSTPHDTQRRSYEVSQASLTHYAARQSRLIQKLSTAKALPVPRRLDEIINAAKRDDWHTLSNLYSQTAMRSDWLQPTEILPEQAAHLWQPILDLYWTFWCIQDWGTSNSQAYVDQLLTGIPDRSVIFAGTDAGRFLLSLVLPEADSSILIVSQNTLADSIYRDYARTRWGDGLWLPGDAEGYAAWDRIRSEPVPGGSVQRDLSVEPTLDEIWSLNFELARDVFQNNRANFSFFVDTEFDVPWMLPYLEPHGFLMRLAPSRVAPISPEAAAADFAFWNMWVARSAERPVARSGLSFRAALARMRSASASIYIYHEQYALAEKALRQALAMYPDSQQATFRLATVFLKTQRTEDARALLLAYQSRFPSLQSVARYLENVDSFQKAWDHVRKTE